MSPRNCDHADDQSAQASERCNALHSHCPAAPQGDNSAPGKPNVYASHGSLELGVKSLGGKPVFVAYQAGFDFKFVYWYLMKFLGESPFSLSALDIKSFAMAALKANYRESTKRNMPKRWFDDLPHTHIALSDAIEQGALFCNMLRESRN